jgi:hypothetical protein
MYAALAYPLLLSLAIPLYAMYLLLKDVVHFYYTIYSPGFPTDLLNPTFSMTGITFSLDESPRVKEAIWLYQYQSPDLMNFVMPFSESRRQAYFDNIVNVTEGDIIPQTRHLDYLKERNIIAADATEDELKNISRFNTALGLTRTLDRRLVEEVAKTEASLVRHIMYLRRLVLRYIKTMLMFIWTTLIAFMMLPFIQDDHFPHFVILGAGYLIWALFVMRIVRIPFRWIYQHNKKLEHLDYRNHIDTQLTMLEQRLEIYCYLAIFIAFAGLILAIIAYIG